MNRLGPDYLERWRRGFPPGDGTQEAALLKVFDDLVPQAYSVLDVGCNIGRIAHLLTLSGFEGSYKGIDQEPVALVEARKRFPGSNFGFTTTRIQDYNPRPVDMVTACEVLMHIPPQEIESVIHRIAWAARRFMVTCDWAVPLPEGTEIDPTNWCHPYEAIYRNLRPAGLQLLDILEAGPLQRVYVLSR